MSTVDPKGEHGKNGKNGELPLLPRWFATHGPRPYWLAEYWSMILSIFSGVVVFINTVVAGQLESLQTKEWVNATVAWVAAAALFLQGRQKSVTRIAKWRADERAKAEPRKAEGEDDDGKHRKEPPT